MKLLVLDLDGTLLNNDGNIGLYSLKFLQEFAKDNIVLLNTARSCNYTLPIILQISNNNPTITSNLYYACLNGCVVYNNEEIKKIFAMSNILQDFKDFLPDNVFYLATAVSIENFWDITIYGENLPNDVVAFGVNCKTRPPFAYKDYFVWSKKQPNIKRWQLTVLANNKLKAVQYIQNLYKIKDEDVYVYGNDYNDVASLKYYKNGIKMKNSLKTLKLPSTKYTNNEDGAIIDFEARIKQEKQETKKR